MAEELDYISFSDVKEGFKKNMKVIKRLLRDAKLCYDKNFYSATVALSILTLEEIAKADFMRRKIKAEKGILRKEWKELTSGRGSHLVKLSLALQFKEKHSERWSEEGVQYLNEMSQKAELPIYYRNKNEIKKEIALFKSIVPKFNILKQLCFYTSWNEKKKEWIYFENKFSDLIQKILTDFLFFEANKQYWNLKFALELPTKLFVDFTNECWEKIKKSEVRKELVKTWMLFNKKIGSNFPLLVNTLQNLEY